MSYIMSVSKIWLRSTVSPFSPPKYLSSGSVLSGRCMSLHYVGVGSIDNHGSGYLGMVRGF